MNYYEERYRLTVRGAADLAASAILVVIGFLWHLPVIFLPLGIGLAVLTAQGAGVIDRPAARWRSAPMRRASRSAPCRTS